MTLAERIRNARLGCQLSQETLAQRAGMSLRAFRSLERGEAVDPHISTVRKLAEALDVSPYALLEEDSVTPLAQAPPPPEATEDGEELDDDPESLRRKNRLLIWTIDYQREEINKPLKSRVEELEAENERLKKVLKSGLVEKMVTAEAGVPSGTEGGRRMAYCRGCGWWLVAEAREVMEAWGDEE